MTTSYGEREAAEDCIGLLEEGGKGVWIVSIYGDNQGILWLGTNDAGAFRWTEKGFEKFRPWARK